MTAQHQQDPYTSPRAFYGAELRREREARGLSQDQLGERVFCSGTYIGQFESAKRLPQPDVSRLLDEVFGTGGYFQRLCRLARKSKHAEYFADAAELEQRALTIGEFAPMLVPGLLQTEGYARALVEAAQRFEPQEVVEGFVTARLERQRILAAPTAPLLWVVLHESVLRVQVGSSTVMAEQLDSLVAAVKTNRRLLMQVLPFAAGAAAFLNGTAIHMTFEDAPPVIYTESAFTGQLIEKPSLVAQYVRAYDLTKAASLPPEASLQLLESVAKEYARQ
ncbi:helix-turn-helix transcriptional regulator [Streptomyces sp. NBC_00102]|uniref:helix-turn-helix domain-containing protein n=1 Tax=Streptomyces sp. NBC_00102 TaxID=2975652 RepID=UPI00224D0736|nr:helix-turn-helix transcriptional regulator [Streptomyces sp. NBC_00102]MCX5399083.1 helix-turn-helix transcriptional regulator [Streptomyces sp. NBC_00102]